MGPPTRRVPRRGRAGRQPHQVQQGDPRQSETLERRDADNERKTDLDNTLRQVPAALARCGEKGVAGREGRAG